jgi:branched-subunit amino acid transport protein
MIEANYFWSNTILLAIGTLLIRSSVIAISSRVRISSRTKEIFSFIPAAVLPALAVPMVFYHEGTQRWLLGKERFAILLLAIVVAYFSKRMTVTLIFGLVALYLINAQAT